MLYFKLLQGGPHAQVDPATGHKRVYSKGEVIESAVDLNKKLDRNKERFKRLEDYEVESYLARQQARQRKEQARQQQGQSRLQATGGLRHQQTTESVEDESVTVKRQQQLSPLPPVQERSGKAVQDPYLTAPHGQVATGFQETTGTEDGQRTGLMVENTPDEQEPTEEVRSEFREYTTDELMEMKVDELRELAEEEDVDLKGLRGKEQIAEAIVTKTSARKAQRQRQEDDDECDVE